MNVGTVENTEQGTVLTILCCLRMKNYVHDSVLNGDNIASRISLDH